MRLTRGEITMSQSCVAGGHAAGRGGARPEWRRPPRGICCRPAGGCGGPRRSHELAAAYAIKAAYAKRRQQVRPRPSRPDGKWQRTTPTIIRDLVPTISGCATRSAGRCSTADGRMVRLHCRVWPRGIASVNVPWEPAGWMSIGIAAAQQLAAWSVLQHGDALHSDVR